MIAFLKRNTLGLVAIFIALSGTAWAVAIAPKNSVVSRSIKNGQVKSIDVRNNALTGADVNEGKLGRVPSAAQAVNASALGGLAPASWQRALVPVEFSLTESDPPASLVVAGLEISTDCVTKNLTVKNVSGSNGRLNFGFYDSALAGNAADEFDFSPGSTMVIAYGDAEVHGNFQFWTGSSVTDVDFHAHSSLGNCSVRGVALTGAA